MMQQVTLGDARPGDVIDVVGHRVEEAPRSGEILEVLSSPHPSFRIKWEDGHVSVLYPGSDVVVSRSQQSG
jgi:Domain of unknown function (DUF1918)